MGWLAWGCHRRSFTQMTKDLFALPSAGMAEAGMMLLPEEC